MCVFCKIVSGDIPCKKIYEDDKVLSFLDVNPTSKGHSLIVSKNHYDNLLKCDLDTMHSIDIAILKIGNSLLKTYGVGLNVLSNVNEQAGQSVMHAHVHLIPVNDNGDKAEIIFKSISDVSLDTILKDIIENMDK